MISLIYGPKGSGKTKRLIDGANEAVRNAKGTVVYISNKPKHSKEVNYNIRFIDTTEYGISCECCTVGFLSGILASDNDIEKVYIDGISKMTGIEAADMEGLYKSLEKLAEKERAEIIFTVSCEKLPAFFGKK